MAALSVVGGVRKSRGRGGGCPEHAATLRIARRAVEEDTGACAAVSRDAGRRAVQLFLPVDGGTPEQQQADGEDAGGDEHDEFDLQRPAAVGKAGRTDGV